MPEQDDLPPGPWHTNESRTRVLDAEGEQIAHITCPNWAGVAALLLRAPEVEQAARELLFAYDVGDDPKNIFSFLEALRMALRMALGESK